MTRHLATKTLKAIDEAISADQGSTYRMWLGRVIPHIGDAYREGNDGFRTHLGASLIGKECARAIWYDFRWATRSDFDGRMIRLFNRGHLEEARFIAMLLAIGCQVYQQDENGNQYRISDVNGHFGGSGDGIITGCPDLPQGTACLTEFKTHSEKSFKELKDKGVKEAKWEHFVQMNVYMEKMGLPAALYLAVNKNTDELYGEIVVKDSATAEQYIERARKIVWLEQPPKKLSNTPGFWKCRFCNHRDVCHLNKHPDKNCRTCEYSKPNENGGWTCGYYNSEIPKEVQLKSCESYQVKKDY